MAWWNNKWRETAHKMKKLWWLYVRSLTTCEMPHQIRIRSLNNMVIRQVVIEVTLSVMRSFDQEWSLVTPRPRSSRHLYGSSCFLNEAHQYLGARPPHLSTRYRAWNMKVKHAFKLGRLDLPPLAAPHLLIAQEWSLVKPRPRSS